MTYDKEMTSGNQELEEEFEEARYEPQELKAIYEKRVNEKQERLDLKLIEKKISEIETELKQIRKKPKLNDKDTDFDQFYMAYFAFKQRTENSLDSGNQDECLNKLIVKAMQEKCSSESPEQLLQSVVKDCIGTGAARIQKAKQVLESVNEKIENYTNILQKGKKAIFNVLAVHDLCEKAISSETCENTTPYKIENMIKKRIVQLHYALVRSSKCLKISKEFQQQARLQSQSFEEALEAFKFHTSYFDDRITELYKQADS
jgi:hypothetical protein